jgi:hypothetical protein
MLLLTHNSQCLYLGSRNLLQRDSNLTLQFQEQDAEEAIPAEADDAGPDETSAGSAEQVRESFI